MEQVLDLYTQPACPDEPLICMDEACKQLRADTTDPLPMKPGNPLREDYRYERHGAAAIFMFFDPLRGWRRASVRDHRTRVDWAEEIRRLLEEDYPQARRVRLVSDNLNTHHIGSLYEAFAPEKARELARRLVMYHTPRKGSWLNMAEIELSIATKQCLDRRIATSHELAHELSAWTDQRNTDASTVHWRFTAADARIKLHRLYPSF